MHRTACTAARETKHDTTRNSNCTYTYTYTYTYAYAYAGIVGGLPCQSRPEKTTHLDRNASVLDDLVV